jgi:hypothetical protein
MKNLKKIIMENLLLFPFIGLGLVEGIVTGSYYPPVNYNSDSVNVKNLGLKPRA